MIENLITAVSRGVMTTLVDGTIRFKIDIEPGDAALAFAMMGMPGSPIVIAAPRIMPPIQAEKIAAAVIEPDPEEKMKGGQLAKLAGMWCNSVDFADWLAVEHKQMFEAALDDALGDPVVACAALLRAFCNIKSRAELDHDDIAAELFHHRIRKPFMAHVNKEAA